MKIRKFVFVFLLLGKHPTAFADGLCIPQDPTTARNWPICAIYMHGLFGAPPYAETLYEVPYRKHLAEVAQQKKCRIAVPFGNQGKWKSWNGLSMQEIVARAKAVCSTASLIEHPDLIGFSNGANALRKQSCSTLSQFKRVTLVGPTGLDGNARVKACGNVRIHQTHEVLSQDELDQAVTYEPNPERLYGRPKVGSGQ